MVDSDYQINELAKRAGVSVRTIRFYIDEGLLPAPTNRGRYSTYTDEYLDRLELIRMLKDRFLPLKRIRGQVAYVEGNHCCPGARAGNRADCHGRGNSGG